MQGRTPAVATASTRDQTLPPVYSSRLDDLALAPLWTALHALLPGERVTRAVPYRWRWAEVRGPLLEAVALRYVNPTTGAPPLPTMACEAHWLRPGETTVGERRTSSAVYHVVEGRGESRVGDAVLSWERGDVFVVPAWHWGEHRNTSPAEPACLFQFNDEPVMRALGLFHEERQP